VSQVFLERQNTGNYEVTCHSIIYTISFRVTPCCDVGIVMRK